MDDKWPEPGKIIIRRIEPAAVGGCGLTIAPPHPIEESGHGESREVETLGEAPLPTWNADNAPISRLH